MMNSNRIMSNQRSEKPRPPEEVEQRPITRISLHGINKAELSLWRKIRATGTMGMVVAVPTGLGMALGTWIDTLWPGQYSWFSILWPVGLGLGCLTAILWAQQNNQTHP